MKKILLIIAVVAQGVAMAQKKDKWVSTYKGIEPLITLEVAEFDSNKNLLLLVLETPKIRYNYWVVTMPGVNVGDKFVMFSLLEAKNKKKHLRSLKTWDDFIEPQAFKLLYKD